MSENGAPRVRVTPFGAAATDALADEIAAAKADDPLAAVTVIVASNVVGLSVRRILGSRGGLANVDFVTPFRLAQLVGGGVVPGTPLTNAVLAAAVRWVLREDPQGFRAVADHHATEAALVAAYAELSRVRPATLDEVASASRTSAEVVRVFRAVRRRLDGFHDEDDLARAALAAVQPLGRVIWHLPDRLTHAMGELLAALFSVSPSTVLVGLTGDPDADRLVVDACRAAGVDLPAEARAAVSPATGNEIIDVSDADEEVRAVTRRILALAEAGVRLDRIAVLHPLPDPYTRDLHEQFEAAGIPHNGPYPIRLADRVAGRTLLAALALADEGWSRQAVLAAASGGPVRHDGHHVPSGAWEDISRRAGIVGGVGDWRPKLEVYATEQRARERTDDADRAEALAAFVEALVEHHATIDESPTWRAKAEATRWLLVSLLGSEGRRTHWPDAEVAAAERVEEALGRLADLDAIDPNPSTATFVDAVTAELDTPSGRIGRFGEGVLVGPLAMAAGLDVDAVFVLGMAEGTCPTRRREDALLPDAARALAPTELVSRDERRHDQHRNLLAALAAGSRHRVLTFPRGDLRGGRVRLPSRWLLDTATALRGDGRVHSSDFGLLELPELTRVASYASGVAEAPIAASLVDRDLATVLAYRNAGGEPIDHPAVAGAAHRGLGAAAARRGQVFTEWDGNLAGHPVPDPRDGQILSASRLERWAHCPYQYFLADVLGLRERDDPEDITEIDAAERGTLHHTILERFIDDALTRPDGPPDPGQPWTEADRDHLQAIADEEFALLEARGRTGRPLLWRLTQQFARADFDHFLLDDARQRAAAGATPVRVELPFGFDDAPPVSLEVGGRPVLFRGKADRVDATVDGGHIVLDYKTGRGRKYDDLDPDTNPFVGGEVLQLGLYAEAARAGLGATVVHAYYWLITSEGSYRRIGYEWTPERRDQFLDLLDAIVGGIGSGTFPAQPGGYDPFWRKHDNCRFCPFDQICPRDRDEYAAAKAGAPELVVLGRLEPPT